MNYENTDKVHLMVWETNPQLRNVNNIICLNVHKSIDLEIGDNIVCLMDEFAQFSTYEITSIISSRSSSLSGYNYLVCSTQWGKKSLSQVRNGLNDRKVKLAEHKLNEISKSKNASAPKFQVNR